MDTKGRTEIMGLVCKFKESYVDQYPFCGAFFGRMEKVHPNKPASTYKAKKWRQRIIYLSQMILALNETYTPYPGLDIEQTDGNRHMDKGNNSFCDHFGESIV